MGIGLTLVCMPLPAAQAGTFEERGATPWAKERLGAMIRAMEPQGDVTVTDVNSVEGEANIFIVRGKKRCGGEGGGGGGSGRIGAQAERGQDGFGCGWRMGAQRHLWRRSGVRRRAVVCMSGGYSQFEEAQTAVQVRC